MIQHLEFVIRTPHDVRFEARVRAARVPTESGQVGLRPRQEPLSLVVEPGLCLLQGDRLHFAATAGGLLAGERERATLYTPFAIIGERGDELLSALEQALATPGGEVAARRRLGELERRIVQELRERPRVARARSSP